MTSFIFRMPSMLMDTLLGPPDERMSGVNMLFVGVSSLHVIATLVLLGHLANDVLAENADEWDGMSVSRVVSPFSRPFFSRPSSRRACRTPHLNTECSICLHTIEETVVLPCEHAFHKRCLEKWFQYKHECPICKRTC